MLQTRPQAFARHAEERCALLNRDFAGVLLAKLFQLGQLGRDDGWGCHGVHLALQSCLSDFLPIILIVI